MLLKTEDQSGGSSLPGLSSLSRDGGQGSSLPSKNLELYYRSTKSAKPWFTVLNIHHIVPMDRRNQDRHKRLREFSSCSF